METERQQQQMQAVGQQNGVAVAAVTGSGASAQHSMNIMAIRDFLPHRYPFLLVDRVLDVVPGQRIVAIKNVSANEQFFAGHFPERPIMPGVLMLEAMAQTAGLLIYCTTNTKINGQDNWFYYAGINQVKFKRVVEPGDQLQIEAQFVKHKLDLWIFQVTANVDGELACSAELKLLRGGLK